MDDKLELELLFVIVKFLFIWKIDEVGFIICCCGEGILELKCVFFDGWVLELVKKVEEIVEVNKFFDLFEMVIERCFCFDFEGYIDMDINKNVLKVVC